MLVDLLVLLVKEVQTEGEAAVKIDRDQGQMLKLVGVGARDRSKVRAKRDVQLRVEGGGRVDDLLAVLDRVAGAPAKVGRRAKGRCRADLKL